MFCCIRTNQLPLILGYSLEVGTSTLIGCASHGHAWCTGGRKIWMVSQCLCEYIWHGPGRCSDVSSILSHPTWTKYISRNRGTCLHQIKYTLTCRHHIAFPKYRISPQLTFFVASRVHWCPEIPFTESLHSASNLLHILSADPIRRRCVQLTLLSTSKGEFIYRRWNTPIVRLRIICTTSGSVWLNLSI